MAELFRLWWWNAILAECIRIFTTWQAIPFKGKFYIFTIFGWDRDKLQLPSLQDVCPRGNQCRYRWRGHVFPFLSFSRKYVLMSVHLRLEICFCSLCMFVYYPGFVYKNHLRKWYLCINKLLFWNISLILCYGRRSRETIKYTNKLIILIINKISF